MDWDGSDVRQQDEVAGSRGPYQVLGVPPDASHQTILHAYRRLAWSSHPDARPDDPEAAARFRMLTGAYEILSDPARRAAYDRARRAEAAVPRVRRPGGRGTSFTKSPHSSSWRSVQPPVRVGPVRIEESRERAIERIVPQAPNRHEVGSFSLLRWLFEGWWQ